MRLPRLRFGQGHLAFSGERADRIGMAADTSDILLLPLSYDFYDFDGNLLE